ncbi:MAG: EAL domain-containing protein [Gammaproteobacteria bacterium]|nr:EAL domain-containing protein [Gammaproteobacteria bacterium]
MSSKSNMSVHIQRLSLKAILLLPLAASLAVFAAVHLYTFTHLEAEYSAEYVDNAFLSAQRVFRSAVRANTDKLSATLTVISQDEALKRAMLAGDRQALLRRAKPVLESLRREYGVTHFYFIRPDRGVFLRVHQPDSHGDVIDRFTAKQAQTTGKLAAGLELGPAGTFTLRTVVPWRDGDRLIGYLELGEEISNILDSIREVLGLELFVTVKKRYLSQQDWAQGMAMLSRQGEWDSLPDSVVIFQTRPSTSSTIHEALAQEDLPAHTHAELSDQKNKLHTGHITLSDAGGREVGNMLLLRDVTARNADSRHDIMLAGGVSFGLGGALLWFFYLVIGRVEKRLASSQAVIKRSEARFRGLVESSSDWIWEVDANARYVYASPKVKDLLGYEPDEVLGKTPFDFMPPEEAGRISHDFASIAAERRPFQALENRSLHRDGRIVVLETSGMPILNQDGDLLGYRGVDRDITARKCAEKIIQESAQRLSLYFQQTPLAVIEWDMEFMVVNWNPAAEKIFGYTKAEAVGRHAMELILPESAKSHVAQMWKNLLTGRSGFRSTNENITKDGKTIYCEWYNTPLIDVGSRVIGVASLAQDVTEQMRAAERVSYLAYYDDLTGLPNRMLFKDRLSQAFTEADRKQRLAGIMLMDLDHFKDVNDTLGHEAGNALLQAVAKRLQDCFRPSDTVARFGGDEFAVVLADVGHADDVVQVAQHAADGFKEPFDILGHQIFVTFSMGITLYPFDDGDVENLLRNADSAMYAAKAAGRNCYRFYAATMTARATARLALQTGLRRALDQEEFILHYQPQLDIGSNRIIGVEALVRWQHPDKGMISPAQFIPVAEDAGLIVPLGEWVLRTACLQAKAWQEQGVLDVGMAVNLSARQFREPLFSRRALEIVNETGLDPHSLELEITESILVEGMKSVSAVLQEFKRAGIMISLDDFGTGYSSLSYLKRFPIDKLKIDQSFVRDVLTDSNDAVLVRAIIALARALRIRVIAEGVETQDHLDFLCAEGCDEIQGYHIARPMPAEQAVDLILRYNTA